MNMKIEKTQTALSMLLLEPCMFEAIRFVINDKEFTFHSILELMESGPLSFIFNHLFPDRQQQLIAMRSINETSKIMDIIQEKLDQIDYEEMQNYSEKLKEKKNHEIMELAKNIDHADEVFRGSVDQINKDHAKFQDQIIELVNLNENFLISYFDEVKKTHDAILSSLGIPYKETTENANALELVNMTDLNEFQKFYKIDLSDVDTKIKAIENSVLRFSVKQIMLQICYNDMAHQRFGSESELDKKAGFIRSALSKVFSTVLPACNEMMERLREKHLQVIGYEPTKLFSSDELQANLERIKGYLDEIKKYPMKPPTQVANEVEIPLPDKKMFFAFQDTVLKKLERFKLIN